MRVCSRAARARTHHTQAIMIFRARANRENLRDSLSSKLAAEFGITSKAVRDIWNLRTWTWKTMPYWTQADHDQFLPKHLCEACKARNVRKLSDACARCAAPPPLGRPAMDRTVFTNTGLSATAHVEEAQAVMETEAYTASAGAWAGAGAATDPAHHFQSGFSDLADGGPMFGGTIVETEASAGALAGAATDPAHHFPTGFSDLADGGSADPTFEAAEAIPSFSNFFRVPSPQELLDGKGICESEG